MAPPPMSAPPAGGVAFPYHNVGLFTWGVYSPDGTHWQLIAQIQITTGLFLYTYVVGGQELTTNLALEMAYFRTRSSAEYLGGLTYNYFVRAQLSSKVAL